MLGEGVLGSLSGTTRRKEAAFGTRTGFCPLAVAAWSDGPTGDDSRPGAGKQGPCPLFSSW